jgi:uncharacterized protein (TIGR01777 family)
MKIAICGATGLIGSALLNYLEKGGHVVVVVSREDLGGESAHLSGKLEGVEGVVNLAGAPVSKKWTSRWKKIIYNSRVETTRFLTAAINDMEKPPAVFISASAVGIYDPYEMHDDYSTGYAHDFLGEVCADWEKEALEVEKSRVRLAILRLGLVLSNNGGALKAMLLPFRMGLGAKMGDGLQNMPFIHLEDLLRAMEWILMTPTLQGIFNLVAPQLVSNREFTQTLANVLHRPVFLKAPVWALKALLGENAVLLTKGQKVIPGRLLKEGFTFKYPDLEPALIHLLKQD